MLYIWDIYSLKTAASVSSDFSYALEKETIHVLLGFVILILLECLTTLKLKKNWKLRIGGFLAALCLLIGYVNMLHLDSSVTRFKLYDKLFTLSFEELIYEDNFNVEGSDGADSEIYKKELKTVIAEAIDALKPKEKQVVTLYYYEKLKFAEIASVLQVSESRVCQIHSKAMLVLKHSLQDYMTR